MKTLIALFTLITSLFTFQNFPPNNTSQITASPDGKKASFKEFLAEFDFVELPYAIDKEDMMAWIDEEGTKLVMPQAPADKERLGMRFTEFLPELKKARFSRMGPAHYYPEVAFEMEQLVAVIYSQHRPFGMKGNKTLAIYNQKGKRLSTHTVANSWLEETTITEFYDKGKFKVHTYIHNWSETADEEGYNSLTLKGTKLKQTAHYQILSNGEIEFVQPKEQWADARASL